MAEQKPSCRRSFGSRGKCEIPYREEHMPRRELSPGRGVAVHSRPKDTTASAPIQLAAQSAMFPIHAHLVGIPGVNSE